MQIMSLYRWPIPPAPVDRALTVKTSMCEKRPIHSRPAALSRLSSLLSRMVFGVMAFLASGVSESASPLPALPGSRNLLTTGQEAALYDRACGLFHPERLEIGSPYVPDRAVCGTHVIAQLASRWHSLSKSTQDAFGPLLFQRRGDTLPNVYKSPGEHFFIHYTLTGTHAVSDIDGDDNGVPDYVDNTAKAFEYVWDLQVNQLGYDPPLADGDDYFDVYIRNLAPESVYGLTYPENFPALTTHSYMEIDNNYTDGIYLTRGLDALQVTAAHEFFHAVQFGYYADVFDAGWWQELTATWMEDVAYDHVNDYLQYVPFFLDFPAASLDANDRVGTLVLRKFGAAIYGHFLTHVYGAASIRGIWESLRERLPDPFGTVDIDMGSPSGGFAAIYPRFAVWNYFTGARSRSGYYPEGDDYPAAGAVTAQLNQFIPASGTGTVDHLGAAYIRVDTTPFGQGLRAEFDLDLSTDWRLVVVLVSADQVEVMYPEGSTVAIPQANRFDEVVFIPMVVALEGESHQYDYVISIDGGIVQPSDLVGDFDANGAVAFSDFLIFVGAFGAKATTVQHDPELDINADGSIDFSDFLLFVQHFGERAQP